MPKLSKNDQKAKISANEARRRKECALAGLREIELRKRLGDFLAKDDVAKAWGDAIQVVRNRLLLLPSKLAPEVCFRTDVVEIQELIRKEIYAALTELSKPMTYGYPEK